MSVIKDIENDEIKVKVELIPRCEEWCGHPKDSEKCWCEKPVTQK